MVHALNESGLAAAAVASFVQPLDPAHSTLGSTLVALIPIVLLLILLPVLRMSAWQAVIIGAVVTIGRIVAVPWSHLSSYDFVKPAVTAVSSLSHKPATVAWEFAPAIAGTWILASWLIIVVALRATTGSSAASCQPPCAHNRRPLFADAQPDKPGPQAYS